MTHPKNYTFTTLQQHIGHEFGPITDISISQERINLFADATGDHQWTHVDVERAEKESPFGTTIAHGFLTLSLVAGAISSVGIIPQDSQAVFNYGTENVRFLAPVPAGATVKARFTLKDVQIKAPDRKLLRVGGIVDIVGSEKPALIGDFLALVVG